MVIVGLDYGHAGQLTLDEITGGSPYGATTIAGGDGSRQPTANELQGARYQGRKIGETAKKLHGCSSSPLEVQLSAKEPHHELPAFRRPRSDWSAVRHERPRQTRGLWGDDHENRRRWTSVP